MTQRGARGMIRPKSFRGQWTGSCDVPPRHVRSVGGPMCRHHGVGPARQRPRRSSWPPGCRALRCEIRWPGSRSSGKKGIGAFLGDRDRRAAGVRRCSRCEVAGVVDVRPSRARALFGAPSPPPHEPWRLQSGTPRLLRRLAGPARHPRGRESGNLHSSRAHGPEFPPHQPDGRRDRDRAVGLGPRREDASAQRLRQARRPQAHRYRRPSKGPRPARPLAEWSLTESTTHDSCVAHTHVGAQQLPCISRPFPPWPVLISPLSRAVPCRTTTPARTVVRTHSRDPTAAS
jgi:hypothetical protein